MSQDDSDSEVEVVLLHRSPRTRREFSNNSLENENRHVTNRYEPVIEDVDVERERVIILSSTESFHEDERDSGISEPAEEHLLPQLEVSPDGTRVDERERICSICIQVFIPFLIAGFGMLAAGLLLDAVQHWRVFEDLNEIFILVPALLGLKGNLEMTLASRLSTAANVGQLDSWSSRWSLTWGNLALIQGQALIVAGMATLISILLGRDLSPAHMLVLAASAMGSAAIASAVLGSVMIMVILVSHRLRINPDNVATPIAASLGDLVTLGLLSLIAQGLYHLSGPRDNLAVGGNASSEDMLNATSSSITTMATPASAMAVSGVMLLVLVLLIPVWLWLAYRNKATKSVLFYGWFPVVAAVFISSGGGYVLSKTVSSFQGFAIYSPIINGVGGNLVAVQASRISTALHKAGSPGKLSSDSSERYHGPLRTFCSKSQHSKTAMVLVGMVIPGSATFLFFIYLLQAGHTTLSAMFFVGYLICAVLQVVILLLVADWMVHFIWNRGFDPDNVAIPFLTALGDLLGTGLLSLGFYIMWHFGDKDTDVGD